MVLDSSSSEFLIKISGMYIENLDHVDLPPITMKKKSKIYLNLRLVYGFLSLQFLLRLNSLKVLPQN